MRNLLKYDALPLPQWGKILVCCLLCFPSSRMWSQVDSTITGCPRPLELETILPDVLVAYSLGDDYMRQRMEYFSAKDLENLQGKNLGEVLAGNSGAFVRSYGSGGTSTVSIQGGGSAHTQVTWMGIPVNSPSLGLSDFSQFPVELLSEAGLSTSPVGLQNTSGGFGGSVWLDNGNPYKYLDKNVIGGSLFAGSFGRFGASGIAGFNSGKTASTTRLVGKSFQNNFSFRDLAQAGTPEVQQEHARFRQAGFSQDFSYQINRKNSLYFKSMVVGTDREIPPVIGGTWLEETQQDLQAKTAVKWNNENKAGYLQLTGAWFADQNNYQAAVAGVNAQNLVHSFSGKGTFYSNPFSGLPLQIAGSMLYRHDRARTDGWSGIRPLNTVAAYGSLIYAPSQRFLVSIGARSEARNGTLLPLMPLAAAHVRILNFSSPRRGFIDLKATFSRNVRYPGLNDLFWNPGGNPNLLPERGLKAEFGPEMETQLQILQGSRMEFHIKGYASRISDWILWVPGTGGIWSAENVQEVFARGIESQLELKGAGFGAEYQSERERGAAYLLRLKYTLALSEDVGTGAGLLPAGGNQLIFIPQHSFAGTFRLEAVRWFAEVRPSWTGRQYVTRDNSGSLDPFFLTDITAGWRRYTSRNHIRVSLTLENAFNKEYQVIQNRPMPGRGIMMTLTWNHLKTKTLIINAKQLEKLR